MWYFIGGGPEGVIPAEWYSETLKRIVSHGFIVAAVDPLFPGIQEPSKHSDGALLASKPIQHLDWVS